jgi:hypothetical protein
MELNLDEIAKICHNTHVRYCSNMNLKGMTLSWNDVQENHKNIIKDSLQKIINGEIKNPKESHNNFVKQKEKEGWVYGEDYSLEDKINPRLTDFENLSINDKVKEILFFETALNFKK